MTLPILTAFDRAEIEGKRAGYYGVSALSCPYTGGMRASWLKGHTVGKRQRNVDTRDGRHPDLIPRTEFQAEPSGSIRRGGVGGSSK